MSYKVTVTSPTYNVPVTQTTTNYTVSTDYVFEIMPVNLDELTDVEISGNNDKYVLMYDASTGKWRDRNPDEVLIAATMDNSPGYVGIPSVFENQLDVDLDNRIDLDAGEF